MINLIGAGGHATVVADVAMRLRITEIVLWSEREPAPGRFPPLASWRPLAELPRETAVTLAVGDLARRVELRAAHPRLSDALVDPGTAIGSGVRIAAGVVVMPACVLNAHARIGEDAILNTGCIIEHDCVVGRNTHIGPGVRLGGEARVGDDTLVGTGAIVLPGVTVGNRCTVGAGAVVTRPVPDGATVVGVPAREVAR